MKKPVSRRALVQRINRKLAKRGHRLKAGRGEGVGDYYIAKGKQITPHVNIERLGRDMGVLHPYERLEEQ